MVNKQAYTIQTSSFTDWVLEQDTTDIQFYGFSDLATAQYLSDMFSGFMLEPADYNDDGIRIEAKNFEFSSIDEMTSFLSEAIVTHEIYLYTLTFWPSMPYMTKSDDDFDIDCLSFTKPYWKIRCAMTKKI